MKAAMSEPEILITTETTTKTIRTIELSPEQLKAILIEWAKSRGFSHRAEVSFSTDEPFFTEITETTWS